MEEVSGFEDSQHDVLRERGVCEVDYGMAFLLTDVLAGMYALSNFGCHRVTRGRAGSNMASLVAFEARGRLGPSPQNALGR